MWKLNFSDEFKRDAVAQITERGYPVEEVSQRLGVSQHSLYVWKRQLAKVVSGDVRKVAEICQLKRELALVTGERDILETATAYLTFGHVVPLEMQSEVCVHCRASGSFRRAGNVPVPLRATQRLPCMAREDARRTELILQAWGDGGKVDGYRKLHDDLLDQDETCCPNRVARLTGLAGIRMQIGYKRRPGSCGGKPSLAADTTLDRQFDAAAPDRA
jgi:putative transposase